MTDGQTDRWTDVEIIALKDLRDQRSERLERSERSDRPYILGQIGFCDGQTD